MSGTDADKGEIVAFHAARFRRALPASPTRVWDYLTRTEMLPSWFGNGEIEPHAGGAVRLMEGHIRGTVTQFRAPHFLAYTWNVFDPGEDISSHPESYLQLELEMQDNNDTVLTLTHFPIPEPFRKQTCMGWHTFLDLVEAGVKGGPVPARSDLMPRNAALYGVDLDNLAR